MRYATDGLKFTVFTSALIPWKRPSQVSSYWVFSPNGALMTKPTFHLGPRSMAKNTLGRTTEVPALPPSPPSGRPAAATLLPFENLYDGSMNAAAPVTCMPAGSHDMPAGFHQTVVASSATAAEPAYALPRPLMPCS